MPKIVDRELYQKELLDKCFHLFAAKGYASITMRQLAESLGVSTGTLYHYFPSKQAIFEQTILGRMDRSVREISADIAETSSLKNKIALIFQHFEREEKKALEELILYVEYYQHQKREGRTENIFQYIYQKVEAEAANMLGCNDKQAIQFLFSIIDGLLFARIYGRSIDWKAQSQIVSAMLESYLSG
jgi:AcrR family transcriptional regulator